MSTLGRGYVLVSENVAQIRHFSEDVHVVTLSVTDRRPGRPGWAGLWNVEDQWGRVIDVVLQYQVHREAMGPPLR